MDNAPMKSPEERLDALVNNEKATAYRSYTPDAITRLLALSGDPQRRVASIHVAGTNGKGSTCHFMDGMLRAAGRATGLYTSPHLLRLNERISLNGRHITDDELCRYIDELFDLLRENPGLQPTYFDALTWTAFRAFADHRVDIAILETGLGGRLDSTNAAVPLVSVITDIGLDHQSILGPTIGLIAAEKAGIIKPHVPVVTSNDHPEVRAVIEPAAARLNAPLYLPGRDFSAEKARTDAGGMLHFDYRFHPQPGGGRKPAPAIELAGLSIPHPSAFQARNASCALTALMLAGQAGVSAGHDMMREGLANARVPGRFEVLCESPLIVFDPAHNPEALRMTIKTMKERYDGKKFIAVFCFMADKEYSDMVRALGGDFADDLIYFELDDRRALGFDELEKALPPGISPVRASRIEELVRAVADRMEERSAVLATGSFRLYETARRLAERLAG
jgi:dihydrofolate synthase/folylpolyglutamate synthase